MKPLCVALCIVASINGATADTRADIEGIAATIEANYFDPVRAKQIAADLRRDAEQGRYAHLTDREAFAKELTQQLRKVDGHFGVRVRGSQTQEKRRPPRVESPDSRTNYGFKRVERLPGNIGYIELPYAAHFDVEDRNAPARRAANAALSIVRDADAVIIDLRNNGGGSPAMVGYLVSAFVPANANVYNTFHRRDGTDTERPPIPYESPMVDVPVYVLINRGSASAAEAIAYTLQVAKRAQIVGERSAGAANPGASFQSPHGYSVFVATGSPRNPISGRNWEGTGVTPDVRVDERNALWRAQELALERILTKASGAARTDAQAALDSLRSQKR